MNNPGKVRLDSLQIGEWFRCNGKEGQLVYKNDCRARVSLGVKLVVINGEPAFTHKVITDWAPGSEVVKIHKPKETDEINIEEEEHE